jgi:hypothetical protein
VNGPDYLDLDRRRLLTGTALCLSVSVLPAGLTSAVAVDGVATPPWQALFAASKAAAAIGREYLRRYPEEASASWLAERLFGEEAAAERIRMGRQQDFRDGDVVVIDGWFFARTEARLLALLSMRPA